LLTFRSRLGHVNHCVTFPLNISETVRVEAWFQTTTDRSNLWP